MRESRTPKKRQGAKGISPNFKGNNRVKLMMKNRDDVYHLIHQLEYLLLIEGYNKNELATIFDTSVDEINHFMFEPEKANIHQAWCNELRFLYEMNHKANNQKQKMTLHT